MYEVSHWYYHNFLLTKGLYLNLYLCLSTSKTKFLFRKLEVTL